VRAVRYCASVSPNLGCVSAIVRPTPASVSDNLRRKPASIARRAVYYCAPLQLFRRSDLARARTVLDGREHDDNVIAETDDEVARATHLDNPQHKPTTATLPARRRTVIHSHG
jgi:hypothetical protein